MMKRSEMVTRKRRKEKNKNVLSYSGTLRQLAGLITKGAADVHGLTNQFLANSERFDKVAAEFIKWVGSLADVVILVAYNSVFDQGKLYYDCARYNLEIPDHWNFACALKLVKKLRPDRKGKGAHQLESLAKDLQLLSTAQTHNALDDAMLAWKVTKSVLFSYCGMELLPLVQYCLSRKIPEPKKSTPKQIDESHVDSSDPQSQMEQEKSCLIVAEGDQNQLATFGRSKLQPSIQPAFSLYPSQMTLNELYSQCQHAEPTNSVTCNWFHPGDIHVVAGPVY